MSDALLTFGEGFAAFVSPCILPMLPVYLVYLAGGQASQSTRRLLLNTLCFVLGFTVVFVALGASAAGLGKLLNQNRLLLQRISGGVMVLFGLQTIGLFKWRWLNTERRLHADPRDLTAVKSFVFGFAFSFGWTPCVGPLLGAAMSLAAGKETVWHGAALLLAFSLGLGVPFVLAALLMDRLKGLLDWFKRHMRAVQIVSGTVLVLAGLALLLDVFGYWQRLFL